MCKPTFYSSMCQPNFDKIFQSVLGMWIFYLINTDRQPDKQSVSGDIMKYAVPENACLYRVVDDLLHIQFITMWASVSVVTSSD